MDRWRRLQYPGLAAIVVFYLAHVRLLDGRLQDDAFISFRYARNLVEGAGLVWNVGERVEGYTNFLWTLLLALPFAVSKTAEPVLFARVLSIASGIVAIVASFLLARRMAPKTGLLPLLAPLLLAGNWSFAINTMTGLETVFLAALITTGTLLAVMELDDLRYRGASVVFALAALTRPEATGLYLVLFGAVVVAVRGRGPDARRYLVRSAAPFAAIVGAHEVFRVAYYGHLVPNTFVAKFGTPLPPGLPSKGAYVGEFLIKGLDPFVVFSLLAALFVVAKVREPRARLISIAALFGFVNVAVSGADFMIGYRYFVPYVPLLFVASALGAAFAIEKWQSRRPTDKAQRRPEPPATEPSSFGFEAVLLVLAVADGGRGYAHSRDRLHAFEELRRRVAADTGEPLGRWLGAHLPEGTRVATVDIGAIGFYSRLPVVDLSGLTDPAIARLPGDLLDRRLDLDALFARDIGAFVLVSRAPGPARAHGPLAAYWPPGSAQQILADSRLKEGYSFSARYPFYTRLSRRSDGTWQPVEGASRSKDDRDNSYFLELYLRNDLAAAGREEAPPGPVGPASTDPGDEDEEAPPAPPPAAAATADAGAPARPEVKWSLFDTLDPCAQAPQVEIPEHFDRLVSSGVLVAWPAKDLPWFDAAKVADLASKDLELAAAFTATERRASLAVIVYPSVEEFRASSGGPKWSSGLFDGAVKLPARPATKYGVRTKTLKHEVLHAQLHDAVGCMPVWLNEGAASYFAAEPHRRGLLGMLRRRRALPFSALAVSSVGETAAEDVEPVYAQSVAMVEMSIQRKGGPTLESVIDDLLEFQDDPGALGGRMLWPHLHPGATEENLLDFIALRLFDVPRGPELDQILGGAVCCHLMTANLRDLACYAAPPPPKAGQSVWIDMSRDTAAACDYD